MSETRSVLNVRFPPIADIPQNRVTHGLGNPLGGGMEIHKPKAAHSWREFLIEIGTIMCGILIALGLEQTVEALRTGRDVEDARAALHREMAQNLEIATTWKREHPCWLGAIDAAKAWAAAGGDRPAYPSGLMKNYQSSVWDMTRAGAVAHMPLDERLTLAKFYYLVANDTTVIDNHRSMATEMGGYLERDRLRPEEAADLARLAGRLRWISNVESANAQAIIDEGRQLQLSPSASDPSLMARVDDFCRSMHLAEN
jgi:hypothetical protein